MKPNDRVFFPTRRAKFRPFVALFVLALCLVALGVVVSFSRPGLTGVQELDAIHAREPGETPLGKVDAPRREGTPQAETPELTGAAGRKVYLDPVTGKLGPPPPGNQSTTQQLPVDTENALSTSADGLVQTTLTGPAGGVKIDLQGRFRSEVVVTLDAQGGLSTRCAPGTVVSRNSSQSSDNNTLPGAKEREATQREK